MLNTDRVVQRFRNGRETISRTGCVRHDHINIGQRRVVDTVNHRRVHMLPGGGYQNTFCTGRNMLSLCFTVSKQSGALEYDIHRELIPG